PAERAGLRLADAVVAVDGEPLDAPEKQQNRRFRERIAELEPGDGLRLDVLREGVSLEVLVELAEEPIAAAAANTVESDAFGVVARDLVYADRADLRLPIDHRGARLTTVRATGPGGLGGLEAGDIVERVGDRAIDDAASFGAELERAEAERSRELVLFVRRGRSTHFVHVQPGW